MRIKKKLPIMVLTDQNPNKLLFEFKSNIFGYIGLFFGFLFMVASYFAVTANANLIVNSILILFTVLFLYSSIHSFKLSRSLEINRFSGIVNYHESSLYKKVNWSKEFDAFKLIKAFRPLSIATSPRGYKAVNWSIQLITNQNEIFDIGYNQFGAISYDKAEALVDRVASMMSLEKEILA